ncbi:MAG: hypothetical protein WD847_18265 [Pirellulales bacterium]|jgi:hypothetical protein
MRLLPSFGLAAALVAGATTAGADELKSGLDVDAAVGAFDVLKIAGAEDDGVREGQRLCYR